MVDPETMAFAVQAYFTEVWERHKSLVAVSAFIAFCAGVVCEHLVA